MVFSFLRRRKDRKAPPVPEKEPVLNPPKVPEKGVRTAGVKTAPEGIDGKPIGKTNRTKGTETKASEGKTSQSKEKRVSRVPQVQVPKEKDSVKISKEKDTVEVPKMEVPQVLIPRVDVFSGHEQESAASSQKDSLKVDSSKVGSASSLRTEATSEKAEVEPVMDPSLINKRASKELRTTKPDSLKDSSKDSSRESVRESVRESARDSKGMEPARDSRVSRDLRPPRINTDQPVVSSPSSPLSAKSASSVSRYPPASYIRHSRVLSGCSTIAGGLNEMFSPSKTLRHRQKEIITDLPHQLSPVVNLSNAQRLRQYASGLLSVLAADGGSWLPADAVLTGTELSIWVLGASKPRYLNIQDCKILPSSYHVPGDDKLYDLMILQDYDCNSTSLRFQVEAEMHTWLAALHLAKFEQTSLHEAFTAVVLSLKGPQLSDVYTLLAHKKRFARFEWCNLRLPQVSNKWIKLFMAIIPGDTKKNGRVEMYTSEKLHKKNLVLYVNHVNSVYNVYPEDYHMIDFNSIMKLDGEVFVNKAYEHLFGGEPHGHHHHNSGSGLGAESSPKRMSRPVSMTSLSSLIAPSQTPVPSATVPAPPSSSAPSLTAPPQSLGSLSPVTRSRSTSVSSASSFFVNAPSPSPNPNPDSSSASKKDKKTHFFKKQAVNNFVTTSYVYLMPEAHPGVSAIEIMLRNFVHIIDAFKLYGRPDHFSSDKKDMQSLLFGLPSLPHYCYMESEDAYGVVAANFDTARLSDWGEWQWRRCLKEFLRCVQEDGDYRGSGDINELFRSLEASSPGSSVSYGDTSPFQALSRVGSPRGDNFAFMKGSPDMSRLGSAAQELSKLRGAARDDASTETSKMETDSALEKPIEFGDRPSMSRDQPNSHSRDTSHDYSRDHTRERSLHPIVDLPTPIDDAQASYFASEKQIPLRS